MEKNTQLPVEYNPGICNHKRPNGFTAWQMQSESSGSGPDFDEHVTICVCVLCGDINISGRKWDSKSKQTNRFNETFHVYVPKAIDAIVKQANFYNEEAKWSRIDTAYATKLHKVEQENAELRRQNDKMKAMATGWRPLLEEVLHDWDSLVFEMQLKDKITKFLYGE